MNKKIPLKRVVYKVMSTTVKQLFIAILCCGISMAHPLRGQELLSKEISLKVESMEIKKVLNLIEKQADVKFVYSTSSIQNSQSTSLKELKGPLYKVLDQILTPLNVSYEVVGTTRILLRKKVAGLSAQPQGSIFPSKSIERKISGKVTDEKGEGLPGVNILVVGSQTGTSTNESGEYQLSVAYDATALKFSFIGYVSQEVKLEKTDVLNISLVPDVSALNEVVSSDMARKKRKM